jgi:hypothetical protein
MRENPNLLSVTELSEETGLTVPGVRRALNDNNIQPYLTIKEQPNSKGAPTRFFIWEEAWGVLQNCKATHSREE